jgi:hypothetical protein
MEEIVQKHTKALNGGAFEEIKLTQRRDVDSLDEAKN